MIMMKVKPRFNVLLFILHYSFLFVFSFGILEAAQQEQTGDQNASSFQSVIDELIRVTQNKDFATLKQRFAYKDPMRLGQCNTDIGMEITVDKLIQVLINDSENSADIKVNKNSRNGLVETEGWNSEYPYYYFYFTFIKKENKWQWLGVCDSINRSLDFAMSLGGKDKLYDRPPKLPRRGPRVFQDEIALRARIEEIVRFMAFDALKPYAIKQKLIFTECSREIVESAQLKGMEVSSEQVIAFLKKNVGESKEIKPAKGGFSTYLDTEGWKGEYPYVSFWFSETKKGWEWTGVAYCKTSLMKVQFPEESRFK